MYSLSFSVIYAMVWNGSLNMVCLSLRGVDYG